MYRNAPRNSFNPRAHQGGFSRRPGRPIKSFDPSLLINKAATQVVAPDYVPQHAFTDFDISQELKNNITSHGYTKPTEIQDKTIPFLLQGRDVVGIADTGTGKTAAFLIPLIEKISKNRSERVLIMTPTRELAMQIEDQCKIFARGMNIFSILCIGGDSINYQIRGLHRRPHFIIGTPGRLKDLAERKALRFEEYRTIVLDEVDRMLDMGFIDDMKEIVAKLATPRHSLFFSATMQPRIQSVMNSFLTNPEIISVKKADTAKNVEQDVVRLLGRDKHDVLHDLLIQPDFQKVLIFGRTKHSMDKLTKELYNRGFQVAVIHGNKTQAQRKRALDQFKTNAVKILVATDVASRGLDIQNVSHVINFDMPESYEDYVHRIGRTGRADKKGKALTFIG